jgi:uncharacterized protein YbjT (DUF2867 family)
MLSTPTRPRSEEQTMDERPVFLSGATGFIGRHLNPRLEAAGLEVRCGTRSVDKAQAKQPERKWVEFDVERPQTVRQALDGCGSAFYLVHQMATGGGYRERERKAAHAFVDAADEVGVERVVYLGGVAPEGQPSEHLGSRLQAGRILRGGDVSTIELRASMIIGPGSASWQIVRDLAARLPVMLLPSWTQSHSQPVYIDDVVEALLGALMLDEPGSRWFDIPGPEVMTIEEIIERTARLLGGQGPRRLRVPLLSPKLSSYWLRFVTGTDLNVARELVEGLKSDLLAESDEFWAIIDHLERVGFDEATRRTLAQVGTQPMLARTYERLIGNVSGVQPAPGTERRTR